MAIDDKPGRRIIEVENTGETGVYKGRNDTARYLDTVRFSDMIGVPLTEEDMRNAMDDGLFDPENLFLGYGQDGNVLVRADFFGSDVPRIRAYVSKVLDKASKLEDSSLYLPFQQFQKFIGVDLNPDQLKELAAECGIRAYRSMTADGDYIIRFDFDDRKEEIAEKAREIAGRKATGMDDDMRKVRGAMKDASAVIEGRGIVNGQRRPGKKLPEAVDDVIDISVIPELPCGVTKLFLPGYYKGENGSKFFNHKVLAIEVGIFDPINPPGKEEREAFRRFVVDQAAKGNMKIYRKGKEILVEAEFIENEEIPNRIKYAIQRDFNKARESFTRPEPDTALVGGEIDPQEGGGILEDPMDEAMENDILKDMFGDDDEKV